MKRQAMSVSPKELINLAHELVYDILEGNPKGCWKDINEVLNQKCQINIINKEGLSDTWEIEK